MIAPARTFVAGTLEYPFGRGANLQIDVGHVDGLCARVREAGCRLFLPIEERRYRRDGGRVGSRQFVAMDPDGYLLRFAWDLGTR